MLSARAVEYLTIFSISANRARTAVSVKRAASAKASTVSRPLSDASDKLCAPTFADKDISRILPRRSSRMAPISSCSFFK